MSKPEILVVDDDPSWRSTIQLILEREYEVCPVSSREEALAKSEVGHFSLAILDQRISADVSGIELLAELRETRPQLGGIILTGYASVEDAVDSMRTGAIDYVSKGVRDLARVLPARVAAALAEKHASAQAVLRDRLRQGEGESVEFKSSLRWDLRAGKLNRELETVIVRTVAGFLNSDSGGTLIIGVSDEGRPIGLQQDYRTLRRQDRDGFQSLLTDILLTAYGKDVSSSIHVGFEIIDGHDICCLEIRPAKRAVFVPDGKGAEDLFLRTGNSTRQLSTREAIDYCKQRWR